MKKYSEEIESIVVDKKYDISLDEYRAIFECSQRSIFTLMYNSFRVGYRQGKKAGIDEVKNG